MKVSGRFCNLIQVNSHYETYWGPLMNKTGVRREGSRLMKIRLNFTSSRGKVMTITYPRINITSRLFTFNTLSSVVCVNRNLFDIRSRPVH